MWPFSKPKTRFTAFTYLDPSTKQPAAPDWWTGLIRWLPPVVTSAWSYEEREKLAFAELKKQNNLVDGQVWIWESTRA